MKAIRILLATGFCLPMLAQARSICNSPSKGAFSYETRLEPASPPLARDVSSGLLCTSFGAHRAMVDASQRKYFGYDLDIEPLLQANTYRVTFRALSVGPVEMGLVDAAGCAMLALPAFPPPQTVHAGDTIALDLFVNPVTGQKLVDYIQIQKKSQVDKPRGPARDFSVADVEMQFLAPQVTFNGKPVPVTGDLPGGTASATAWIYIPGHGRYLMALAPRPDLGLRKAGEVRGSSLTFTIGADTIVLDCNGRIAPGYTPYNLYVLHETGWLPKDASRRNSFLIGSGR